MPALLCTLLTHAGTAVYRTDTCRHCCVPSGIRNPYLSSNVRCVLLQEPPAYAGSRQNCTHIIAHKAHSLSLALLLCCPISTLTVHYPTIKFGSTRALLRCIRSHTGGTSWLVCCRFHLPFCCCQQWRWRRWCQYRARQITA